MQVCQMRFDVQKIMQQPALTSCLVAHTAGPNFEYATETHEVCVDIYFYSSA